MNVIETTSLSTDAGTHYSVRLRKQIYMSGRQADSHNLLYLNKSTRHSKGLATHFYSKIGVYHPNLVISYVLGNPIPYPSHNAQPLHSS